MVLVVVPTAALAPTGWMLKRGQWSYNNVIKPEKPIVALKCNKAPGCLTSAPSGPASSLGLLSSSDLQPDPPLLSSGRCRQFCRKYAGPGAARPAPLLSFAFSRFPPRTCSKLPPGFLFILLYPPKKRSSSSTGRLLRPRQSLECVRGGKAGGGQRRSPFTARRKEFLGSFLLSCVLQLRTPAARSKALFASA